MKSRLRRYILYYTLRVAYEILRRVPLCVNRSIAKAGGIVAFAVLGRYRRIALANLELAYGEAKTMDEKRSIVRGVFGHLAATGAELIRLQALNAGNIDRFVELRGVERLDRALLAGKGAVVVTGHFGNWELMAVTLRIKGYRGVSIGRRIYFDRYDALLNKIRGVHGANIIYRDESPRKALKVLRQNGIIGVVADQDVDSVDGVFVDFFGVKAFTPSGPAALAQASGAALIPAAIWRDGGRHILEIHEPVAMVTTGERAADVVVNTASWTKVIEGHIREHPEQWVWVHRRWKTRPPAEGASMQAARSS